MGKPNKKASSGDKSKQSKGKSPVIKAENRHAIKKRAPGRTKGSKEEVEDSKKIHYVLNPKKIKEKMMEVKEMERREKEKSHQKQKRKRNAAFLKTTSKGQPVLGARMKILYSQIQRSCGGGS